MDGDCVSDEEDNNKEDEVADNAWRVRRFERDQALASLEVDDPTAEDDDVLLKDNPFSVFSKKMRTRESTFEVFSVIIMWKINPQFLIDFQMLISLLKCSQSLSARSQPLKPIRYSGATAFYPEEVPFWLVWTKLLMWKNDQSCQQLLSLYRMVQPER